MTATFLAGAKSRLLPPSLPFRFFATAIGFHVLLWLVLLLEAAQAISWRGGTGPVLAAIHLLTLGVLLSAAIGASVQLLPVATRRALAATWPIALVFWLTVPGAILLIGGMYASAPAAMIAGGVLASAGLVLFAALLADNLWRAGALGVTAAYGWTALAALLALTGLGLLLVLDYTLPILADHTAAALTHLALGGFGFMGMLALGFSHVLVPMFALAPAPPARASFAGWGLSVAALALGAAGTLSDQSALITVALLVGIGAAAAHLWLMRRVLAAGMRKRLGLSFVLVRASWLMLAATLVVGLAALHGLAGANGPTLFGFLLLFGWLLTFLMGILQRILPFLASMHAARTAAGAMPLMSELAAATPLKLHALCHGAALALLAGAIAFDSPWSARIGCGVGLLGALAFAWFTADVIRHVRWRT
jgi:hypothetical protein